jgi:hypothetical protein
MIRGWCVLVVLGAIAGGCSAFDARLLPRTEGEYVQGMCMCAECLDRPFCRVEEAGGVPAPERFIFPGDDPCPTTQRFGGRQHDVTSAQPARRITAAGPQTFYCIPDAPGLHDVNFASSCPPLASERSRVGHVDTCVDVPECARPNIPCPGSGPDDPPFCKEEFSGAERVACSATFTGGQNKLIDFCAIHDELVPTGEAPQRYCFLSCVDPPFDAPSCDLLEPPDPPEVTPHSLLIVVDDIPDRNATVRVRVARDRLIGGGDKVLDSERVAARGRLAIHAPGCRPGIDCSADLRLVDLHSPETLNLTDATITQLRLINLDPLLDDIFTDPQDPETRSRLLLPVDANVGSRVHISGTEAEAGRRGVTTGLRRDLNGTIDWERRELLLDGQFEENFDGGNVRIELELAGRIVGLLPTAHAGADQTVECASPRGTPVSLSATASTDPDGFDNLVGFAWSAHLGGDIVRVALGAEAVAIAPPGTGVTEFGVFVINRMGRADADTTRVTVEDTTPPEFREVQLATDCLWSPNHEMHLFRLGTEIVPVVEDACDGAISEVRIIDAYSDQPDNAEGDGNTLPDVRFGSGAVCLRSERDGREVQGRTYTIVLEAKDAEGNTIQAEVIVRVPHDQRPAQRCEATGMTPVVDDDDPACVASVEWELEPEVEIGEPARALAPPGEARGCSAAGPRWRPPLTGVWVFGILALWLWLRRRGAPEVQ